MARGAGAAPLVREHSEFTPRRTGAGGASVAPQRQRDATANHLPAICRRGVFAGSAGPLPDGEYRAWIAAPTSETTPAREFSVIAPPGELARTQMDSVELREAARLSVGRFYTFATAGKLLADLPRGRQV